MEEKDIREICRLHQLQCDSIEKATGSFDKELFFIDNKYLLRTSRQPMLEERKKINRVRDLKQVPKIVYASDQDIQKQDILSQRASDQDTSVQDTSDQRSAGSKIYYLILEYIHGCELFTSYDELNDQEIFEIGVRIADFLEELHGIKGEQYDIGHYVPIIPDYDQSWRSGHQSYWENIYSGVSKLQLSEELRQKLELSNQYINENLSCLEYEDGPVLLHNDFHYKNIIIDKHTFSGVIDWECSQFGEADFDLIHLVHWSLFPPSNGVDMMQLFRTIFLRFMKRHSIPAIEKRLTIYLLEHDFIQILWSEGKRAEEYLSRIDWWLSGNLENYIQKLKESL